MRVIHINRILVCLVLLTGGIPLQAAYEVWTDVHGSARMAELVHAYGPMAYFRDTKGDFAGMRIEELTEDCRERIESFRKTQGHHPWKTSTSAISQMLAGKLYYVEGGEPVAFDYGPEAEPDFYLFCQVDPRGEEARILIPKLIKAYADLKEIGLDNFEVILVGHGRRKSDYQDLIRELEIPWPILEWKSRKQFHSITAMPRKSNLAMALTDQAGNVLQRAVSGRNGESPISILVALNDHLTWTNPDNFVVKRINHGKFLKEYLEKPRADTPPIPHDCSREAVDFSSLPEASFTVRLLVTEKGLVADPEILTELPESKKAELLQTIAGWLFIPCIQNGEYAPALITFPVSE